MNEQYFKNFTNKLKLAGLTVKNVETFNSCITFEVKEFPHSNPPFYNETIKFVFRVVEMKYVTFKKDSSSKLGLRLFINQEGNTSNVFETNTNIKYYELSSKLVGLLKD